LLKRIVGGEVSKENEWPGLVHLLVLDPKTNTYKHKCAGSLIDSEWVLTTANCLAFAFKSKFIIKLGKSKGVKSPGEHP